MTHRAFYISAFLFFVFAFCFLYGMSYGNRSAGLLSDDALYLIMADYYSPWVKTLDHVQAFVSVTVQFPPLYSVFLGIFGAGTENPGLAFLLNTACLSFSLLIVVIWLRKEADNTAIAFMVGLLTLLVPELLLLSQELWSEFLFMVFFYLFFYVFSQKEMQKEHFFLCALLAGLMTLTRSLGISVVLAYSIYLIFKRPAYFRVYIGIAVLPFVYSKIKSGTSPLREDYTDVFATRVPDIFSMQIVDFISEQFVSLWHGWVYIFSPVQMSFLPDMIKTIILIILLLMFFIGLILRMRDYKIDALTVFIYLAIVFVWPFTEERFVSRFLCPLFPLFIFYIILGCRFILQKVDLPGHVTVVPLLVVMVTVFSDIHILNRAYASMEPDLKPYSRIREWLTNVSSEAALSEVKIRKRYIEILKELQEYIPEDDCTYALHTPLTMMYTKRLTGHYLDAASNVDELLQKLPVCNYMISTYLTDYTGNYSAFYPMELVWDQEGFEFYAFHMHKAKDREDDNAILLMLIKRNDKKSRIDRNRAAGSDK